MSNKRRKTQLKIEDLFNKQGLHVDGEDILICPICLRVFTRGDIEVDADQQRVLSIEDAPQKQQGAQAAQRCLTCRRCNNECGFESRVGKLKKIRESPRIALPTSPRVDWLENELGLFAPRVRQPHVHARPTKSGLLSAAPERKRSLRFAPDESLIELKNAYLIAFAALGYAYILDPALEVVRQAILEEESFDVCVRGAPTGEGPIPDDTVAPVTMDGIPLLMVTIKPSHRERSGRQHSVLLPRPGSPINIYDELGLTSTLRPATSKMGIEFDSREFMPVPAPLSVPRHWDRCEEAHPRSDVQSFICEIDCVHHGLERIAYWEGRAKVVTDSPS